MKRNWFRGMISAAVVAVIVISVMACGGGEEGTSRPSSGGITDADRDYAARISDALDVYIAANTALGHAATYAGETGDFDGLDAVADLAGDAADAVRRIRPTGASKCVQDVDALFDRSMETYITAMSQIATGVRLIDPSLLVDARGNMDRASSQMLSATAMLRECTSQ